MAVVLEVCVLMLHFRVVEMINALDFTGAAHVGMVKAILESGVPIDLVGGTSIGAFFGALWARETDVAITTTKARDWSFVSCSFERDF